MENEAQGVTERINDFVVIDQSVANHMIKAYNEAYEVESLERLLGGKSTSNYKVCVKNIERPMVLRVYPSTHTSGGKELSLSRSMKGIIPVPEIYYYNDEKTIMPFDFALVAFVEGTPLDLLGGPTDGIAYQLGEILACIHYFEYPKEGLLDDSLNLMAGLPPIQAWYDYFINGRAGNRLKASTKDQLLAFGASYRLIMTEICERFMLSHGDFRPANILIHEDRVVGIMDWEFALSAPCYFDIGQFMRDSTLISPSAQLSFIKGYNQVAKYPIGERALQFSEAMDLMNLMSMLDSAAERPNLYAHVNAQIEAYLQELMTK